MLQRNRGRGEGRREDSKLGKFRKTYDDERSLLRVGRELVIFHTSMRAPNVTFDSVKINDHLMQAPRQLTPTDRFVSGVASSISRRILHRDAAYLRACLQRAARQTPETKNLIAPLFAYLPALYVSSRTHIRAQVRADSFQFQKWINASSSLLTIARARAHHNDLIS